MQIRRRRVKRLSTKLRYLPLWASRRSHIPYPYARFTPTDQATAEAGDLLFAVLRRPDLKIEKLANF